MKLTLLITAAALLVAATASAAGPYPQNGRVLYTEAYAYAYGAGSLYAINRDGTGRVLIADRAANGSWSPDGKRIVFESSRKGDPDLWLVNADGSGLKELTFSVGVDQDPAWSPDGTAIAFESNRNNPNGMDVFVTNLEGQAQRLTDGTGWNGDPAWSPDGSRIVFTSNRAGSKDIWTMASNGNDPVRLTSGGGVEENPAWSPDGKRIVFDTDDAEPGNLEIFEMDADGGDLHPLITSPALDAEPAWSPDSKWIAFASERGGKGDRRVYVVRSLANTTGPVELLALPTHRNLTTSLPSWGSHPVGDPCTIEGTIRADVLHGSPGRDVICGGAGNDMIYAAGGGRDRVDGGSGRDVAYVDRADVVRNVETKRVR